MEDTENTEQLPKQASKQDAFYSLARSVTLLSINKIRYVALHLVEKCSDWQIKSEILGKVTNGHPIPDKIIRLTSELFPVYVIEDLL